MPFEFKPVVGLTYIDASTVSDPKNERLKVTLEDDTVVMFMVPGYALHPYSVFFALVADAAHSDERFVAAARQAILDSQLRVKYRKKFLGIKLWLSNRPAPTDEMLERDSYVSVPMGGDPRDVGTPVLVGEHLHCMVGLHTQGGSSHTFTDLGKIVNIESITLED